MYAGLGVDAEKLKAASESFAVNMRIREVNRRLPRLKVSFTGTLRIWLAISAASFTFSNSSLWPKLPPAYWLCSTTWPASCPVIPATCCCRKRGIWCDDQTSTASSCTRTIALIGSSGACAT